MKKPFKFLIAALVALVVGGTIGYFTVDAMNPAANGGMADANLRR